MPEFDIDSFKKTWQQQNVAPKYDSEEILRMLNRNSQDYVKYILWISIAEFLFIIGISVYYFRSGEEGSSFLHILQRMKIQVTPQIMASLERFYSVLKFTSVGITLFFVVKFFRSYRRIHVESNLKKFILQIISFKKTVNLFILVNILFLVFTTLLLTVFIFRTLALQNVEMSSSTIAGFITGLIISLAFSVGLIWLYYRLVYGIIMKRLSRNLAQLQEIEKDGENADVS